MAINLSKGQKLDLSKDSSLTQVRLGLGWDPIKTKGLFGRIKEKAVDLDASVIGYDAAGNLLEVVFYGSLRSVNGSIIHHGDNLTGAGEGDDEVIDINLPGVDARVAFLALVITSYSGDQFSNIDNAFVRVENVATRQEMARFFDDGKGLTYGAHGSPAGTRRSRLGASGYWRPAARRGTHPARCYRPCKKVPCLKIWRAVHVFNSGTSRCT